MSAKEHPPAGSTEGSSTFDAWRFLEDWDQKERFRDPVPKDNFQLAIVKDFKIDAHLKDTYTYHAIASVMLDEVQLAISKGGERGLHSWYLDDEGKPITLLRWSNDINSPELPQSDISAYTAVFNPTLAPAKSLKNFASNAKKGSIRARVAAHLLPLRVCSDSIIIPRARKGQHFVNPYLDYWRWACHNLEWCGPDHTTGNIRSSHHILPVFMHHFGCVVPSYEAVEVIKIVAEKRTIVDLGSGNGYWSLMLLNAGLQVASVDNMQSLWRTMWISNTIVMDGVHYMQKHQLCANDVLLMVYPIVGADFTRLMLKTYAGDTVIVAGTQNSNGYTAFRDMTIDTFFEKEMPGWEKIVQIPLPSFPGKDEAMYVFVKKKLEAEVGEGSETNPR